MLNRDHIAAMMEKSPKENFIYLAEQVHSVDFIESAYQFMRKKIFLIFYFIFTYWLLNKVYVALGTEKFIILLLSGYIASQRAAAK